MNQTIKIKNGGTIALIMVNVMLIIMIVAIIGMTRFSAVINKYGSDWPEVEVTIDDVSFEYSDSDSDDGDVTYYFDLNRILHFTYNGVEYEIEDKEELSSSSRDFTYELKTGYKDKYTYKINPDNPNSYSKSYSAFSDPDAYLVFDKIFMAIPITILVIVDAVAIISMIKKKKNVFEQV